MSEPMSDERLAELKFYYENDELHDQGQGELFDEIDRLRQSNQSAVHTMLEMGATITDLKAENAALRATIARVRAALGGQLVSVHTILFETTPEDSFKALDGETSQDSA